MKTSTKNPCVLINCMFLNEDLYLYPIGYITKIGKTIIDNKNLHLKHSLISNNLGTHRFYVKGSPVFTNNGPFNFQMGENAQYEIPQFQ